MYHDIPGYPLSDIAAHNFNLGSPKRKSGVGERDTDPLTPRQYHCGKRDRRTQRVPDFTLLAWNAYRCIKPLSMLRDTATINGSWRSACARLNLALTFQTHSRSTSYFLLQGLICRCIHSFSQKPKHYKHSYLNILNILEPSCIYQKFSRATTCCGSIVKAMSVAALASVHLGGTFVHGIDRSWSWCGHIWTQCGPISQTRLLQIDCSQVRMKWTSGQPKSFGSVTLTALTWLDIWSNKRAWRQTQIGRVGSGQTKFLDGLECILDIANGQTRIVLDLKTLQLVPCFDLHPESVQMKNTRSNRYAAKVQVSQAWT